MLLTTRLLIVDDHQMLLDGIRALLQDVPNFQIVAEAHNGMQALEELKNTEVDIVVTDISMPDMNGIELTQKIKVDYPNIKVLTLSMFSEKQTIREMVDAGVSGYILKNTGKEELVGALTKIASGGIYFGDEVTNEMMRMMTDQDKEREKKIAVTLTFREKEILKLIAKEYSNVQIAAELFISERTVETHRKNIFRKTNTKSIVGLIKYAYEYNLI
jgi:two-component system, NarL family, nitrate/nitrite response regulator NarL